MKYFTLLSAFLFIICHVSAQKNENRIIHINGDDTLVLELGGMKGDFDSIIEETLKSFYNLDGMTEIKRFGFSMDSLITEDFDIKIENKLSKDDSVKIKIGNMKIVIIENKDKSAKEKTEENEK